MKGKVSVNQGPMPDDEKAKIRIEDLQRQVSVLSGEKEMAMKIVRQQDERVEFLEGANRSLQEKIEAQRAAVASIHHGIKSLAGLAEAINSFATPVKLEDLEQG